jgi:hypothetical protein
MVILGLAACLTAASTARAQTPPAEGAQAPPAGGQQAAAPAQAEQPAPPDPFKFTSDAAVIIWQIKPESTGDFESVWGVIRSRAAAATDKPEVKSILDSMKMYKHMAPPGTSGPVTYFFQIDPVLKSGTYNPTFLLYESGMFERAEADELFNKLNTSINPPGINPIPLQPMTSMPSSMPSMPPASQPMGPGGAAPPAGGSMPGGAGPGAPAPGAGGQ